MSIDWNDTIGETASIVKLFVFISFGSTNNYSLIGSCGIHLEKSKIIASEFPPTGISYTSDLVFI